MEQTIEIDAKVLVALVQRVERLERALDEFMLQRREVALIEAAHVERARGMERTKPRANK